MNSDIRYLQLLEDDLSEAARLENARAAARASAGRPNAPPSSARRAAVAGLGRRLGRLCWSWPAASASWPKAAVPTAAGAAAGGEADCDRLKPTTVPAADGPP